MRQAFGGSSYDFPPGFEVDTLRIGVHPLDQGPGPVQVVMVMRQVLVKRPQAPAPRPPLDLRTPSGRPLPY